jgi:hypothetical protein
MARKGFASNPIDTGASMAEKTNPHALLRAEIHSRTVTHGAWDDVTAGSCEIALLHRSFYIHGHCHKKDAKKFN